VTYLSQEEFDAVMALRERMAEEPTNQNDAPNR
jgi:hypothetical protein